jgi:hypothetical protein
MGMLVTSGSQLMCTFGVAPSIFNASPAKRVTGNNMPVGNIMDNLPGANILPFGVCNSPSNPQVAAATAAAFGVLTPMPCVPVTVAPWTPGSPTVLIGNMPALTNTCKLTCTWGGMISVLPGPPTAQVPG